MTERSNRMDVRNPLLKLPAMKLLQDQPLEVRTALALILYDLADDARGRSDASWDRNKAWMAAYWRIVSVYARHIARALMRGGR